jgi:hypothetical protein
MKAIVVTVDGPAVDFVVVSDRAQLTEFIQQVREGRLRTNIGTVASIDDAVAAFNPTGRVNGRRYPVSAHEYLAH